MKHALTVTGQYLAAILVVALSVSAYGCGDAGTVDPTVNPTVNPVIELSSLTATPGTLQPPFNPATTDYTVQLSSNVSSTTITASPRVAGDIVRIDNQEKTSQTINLDSPGDQKSLSIVVTETGTGGSSRSYTVRVKRDLEDNSLEALSVSTGTLAPSPFEKDQLNYTVNDVGKSVTKVTISATKSDPNAVMQIGSVTVPAGTASGQADIILGGTGSPTAVSIDVTRPSGSKRIYSVVINRDASDNNFLKSLSISSGKLDFKVSTTVYDVSVASNVEKVTVTATPQDSTASITFFVNGSATNPQSIPLLGPGLTTNIKVRVTAQNGTPKDYDINVKRAALDGNNDLRSLSVSPGKLDTSFNANDLDYTVNVGSNDSSITVNATKDATTAQIAFLANGEPINSQPIPLLGPDSTTIIKVRVTAQNGKSKDYVIRVVRAALGGNNKLSALSVTAGGVARPLDFKADRNTVNVPTNVAEVTVSATKSDSNATMAIGSVTVAPGTGTGEAKFPLNGAGLPTSISVTVTAQNGVDSKTYTITVNRAAPASPPPAPAPAPDLISADDSCLLKFGITVTGTNDDCDPDSGTSRDDNKTNVTTPRFKIPQPGSGETPNLYVDGRRVGSLFDAANSTLQPTTPLRGSNDGVQHSITSTVTNTATNLESDQSDALIVTISSGQSGV